MITVLFLTTFILVCYTFFQDATRDVINRFVTPSFDSLNVYEEKKKKMTSRGSQEDSNVINPNENVSNSPEQMKGIKKKTNSKSPCTNSTNSDITNSDELDKTQKSETSVSAKK